MGWICFSKDWIRIHKSAANPIQFTDKFNAASLGEKGEKKVGDQISLSLSLSIFMQITRGKSEKRTVQLCNQISFYLSLSLFLCKYQEKEKWKQYCTIR